MRFQSIGSYLQLLRIWLLPTAWADVLAGAFLSGGSHSSALISVSALSSCLYLFGMVSNALLDLSYDREKYPTRPLPSGRVSVQAAVLVAAILLFGALLFWLSLRWRVRLWAAFLLLLILLYNSTLKRIPVLGPLCMAGCRGVNLAMGASLNATLSFPVLRAAAILSWYVFWVTILSSWEGDEKKNKLRPFVVFLLSLSAFATFLAPLNWGHIFGLLLLGLLCFSFLEARKAPSKEALVHNLLPGIYLIDAYFMAKSKNFAIAVVFAAICALTQLFTYLGSRKGNT